MLYVAQMTPTRFTAHPAPHGKTRPFTQIQFSRLSKRKQLTFLRFYTYTIDKFEIKWNRSVCEREGDVACSHSVSRVCVLCCVCINFEKENGRQREEGSTTHARVRVPLKPAPNAHQLALSLSLYIEIVCLTVQNINLTVNTLITRFYLLCCPLTL